MATLLPGVITILRKTATPPNPQDLASIAHVVGPVQSLPNLPNPPPSYTINSVGDLADFGSGETVEMLANTLQAGGPVYFTPSAASTPGTIGAITKTFGNPVGVPLSSFGAVLVPGADANGDVLFTAKQTGVSLLLLDPGVVTATTTVTVIGPAIQVTLKRGIAAITETGTGLVAAITASAPALALVAAVAQGTGASVVGALANTALDNGGLTISALVPGISYRVLLSGNNTAFSTSYAANVITVTLATNATGEPTTTATTAQTSLAALALSNPGVFTSSLAGSGAGLLGAKAVTALAFGSTGAATAAGSPTDIYNVVVEFLRAGTIGGPSPITMRWSVDNGANYSSAVVIPASGIYKLKDNTLDSDVTMTFTGQFDIGDKFTFATTGPVSSPIDLYAAIDIALSNYTISYGFITSPVEVSRATSVVIDSKLQAARQNRKVYGIFTARKPNQGESEITWENSLINDFIGFDSLNGLFSKCAGTLLLQSTYSGRQFVRNNIHAAVARAASIPVHEDLGCLQTGPLRNVLNIYHDETKSPALDQQRFITTMTYPTRPGQFYFVGSPTSSNTSDVGYTLLEWIRVILSIDRISADAALLFVNSVYGGISQLDGTNAPLGAMFVSDANKIEKYIKQQVDAYVFKPKSDGQVSASSLEVRVLRNYSFIATREVRVEIDLTPLGLARNIIIGINVNIPQ